MFNPWWEIDEENDIGPIAPAIRRKQLRAYLEERLANARFAIVGEALGYRGGHFTGIPMTSERILLRKKREIVAALCERRNPLERADDAGRRPSLQILSGIKPRRTSKPSICLDGFSEPTATIVWSALLKIGVLPDEFVLWNAFPWHSFDRHRGLLSNRMPNKSEQLSGRPMLKAFLELFPCEQIVALGKSLQRSSSNSVLMRAAVRGRRLNRLYEALCSSSLVARRLAGEAFATATAA